MILGFPIGGKFPAWRKRTLERNFYQRNHGDQKDTASEISGLSKTSELMGPQLGPKCQIYGPELSYASGTVVLSGPGESPPEPALRHAPKSFPARKARRKRG